MYKTLPHERIHFISRTPFMRRSKNDTFLALPKLHLTPIFKVKVSPILDKKYKNREKTLFCI